MLYEVFIPSAEPDGFDESITVDAENWMAALKSGLERTGEAGDIVRNLMCDIKDDNSIHVTDATTRRVFVLRELEDDSVPEPADEAPQEEELKTLITPSVKANQDALRAQEAEQAKAQAAAQAKAEADAAAKAQAAAQAKAQADAEAQAAAQAKAQADAEAKAQAAAQAKAQADAEAKAQAAAQAKAQAQLAKAQSAPAPAPAAEKHTYEAEGQRIRIGSATHKALKEEDKSAARVVSQSRTKSDANRVVELGRANEKVSESLIEDIFLEIQEIHEGGKSMEEVIDFVMDMAMEKIGAESGSVLFADVNGQELYFATARGPKADEIMDFRVPMGKGIVGFCTREGVSLAISDAENDPRFYKEISESLGYDTHGLLCAPIQHEGRVYGAIEVMNKKASGGFRADETNALAYIGRQLAQYVHGEIMRNEKIN